MCLAGSNSPAAPEHQQLQISMFVDAGRFVSYMLNREWIATVTFVALDYRFVIVGEELFDFEIVH